MAVREPGFAASHSGFAHPKHYAWLVAVAVLDVVMTWICLGMGAIEANPLANGLIQSGGMPAAAALKLLCLIALVLGCEFISRRRPDTGRRVVIGLSVLWTLPPLFALVQIGAVTQL